MFAPPHADGVGGIAVAVADIAIRVAADNTEDVDAADNTEDVDAADNTEDVDAVVDFRVAAVDTAGLPADKAD